MIVGFLAKGSENHGEKMGKSWEKMMSRLIQMMIFEWLKYVEMDVQWLFDMG